MKVRSAAVLLASMTLACSPSSHELPPSFAATTANQPLITELGAIDVWQVRHPEYTQPLKVLVLQKTLRGFVDYQIGFYRLDKGTYQQIGRLMTIGGFDRPVLGRHPALELPAVVAKIADVDELMYVFVSDGTVHSQSSAEDEWIAIEQHPLIKARARRSGQPAARQAPTQAE